ncbi:MAG: DUF1800 family protein [Planctomycetota bacterium]
MIPFQSARLFSGLAVVWLAVGGATAEATAEIAAAELTPVAPRFPTDATTLWSGATQAVVFELDAAASSNTVLEAAMEPASLAEVVGDVTVVVGAEHGVVRMRGLREGQGVLRVGEARVAIDVRDMPEGTEPVFTRPRLATPTMGARVWGEVLVAVELFDDEAVFPGTSRAVTVEVKPANAVSITPIKDTGRDHGPNRLLTFALDASKANPGDTIQLRAVAEHDGRAQHGPWTAIGVVHPTDDRLIAVEAETQVDVERPEQYRGKLTPRENAAASNGQFVNVGSRNPVPIEVNTGDGGWYQAMAVAAADPGGGAWPTVGLRLGDNDDPVTGGIAAVADAWERITVGRPVWIDAGEQMAFFTFENDFSAGRRSDRNLRLDRVELLRLDGPRPGFTGLEPPTDLGAIVASSDLRVTPDEVWHGRHITGRWPINATVSATLRDGLEAPLVTLELDGRRVLAQRAWRPQFELHPAMLSDGPTRVRLLAELGDGRVAASPEQVVIGQPADASLDTDPTTVHRIAIDDARAWDDLDDATLEWEGRWGRVARLLSNGSIGMALPEGLEGRYVVSVLGTGDEFDGRPIGEVTLHDAIGNVVHAFEPAEFRRGWREVRLGAVNLDGTTDRLSVAFTNDKHDAGNNKDRNLHVAAVVLRPAWPQDLADAPPAATLRYPVEGDRQHGVDAVVADIRDDVAVKWVELVIDGTPTAVRLTPLRGGGRAVLPVVWRGIEPGPHAVSVRVADSKGQVTESEPVTVELLAREPSSPTAYARAVRLLDRFAFGPEPRALGELLVEGERPWLQRSLSTGWADAGVACSWHLARTRHRDGQPVQQAMSNLLRTPNPVRARLTMFVDNHFNTWQRKTEADRKAAEHQRFVELGAAPFLAALEASTTSPAMLRYLDQSRSFGRRINENYAREIMELHTLGVDSAYAQNDVTELSHVLAGWRGTDEGDPSRLPARADHHFRYVPQLNDGEPRVVFGLALPQAEPGQRYDRPRRVVEMLAAHPDTAHYLASKLVASYLVTPPPPALVDELAAVFIEHGGDLAQVMLALAEHPYATGDDLGARLQRPLEHGVGLARLTDPGNSWRLINFLKRTGDGLFDRETPDGYDADPQSYANSNAMLQRWRLAQELEWHLANTLPRTMWAPRDHPRWDQLPDDQRQAQWSQAVIDVLAIRLTGEPLGERSNQAALEVLAIAPDNADQRARVIATFVAQLPEAQQQR